MRFTALLEISKAGPVQQLTDVEATNQFGPVTLNLKAPKTLLVPTAVNPDGPPASPDGAELTP